MSDIVKEVLDEVHKCKFNITEDAIRDYVMERYFCEDIADEVILALEEEQWERHTYETDLACRGLE